MARVTALWIGLACAVLTSSCSSDPGSATLTIDARVVLCPKQADCVALPAAGADVVITRSSGAVYRRTTLGERGSVSVTIRPGAVYEVRVSVPSLKVVATANSSAVNDGEENELSLDLPSIELPSRPR